MKIELNDVSPVKKQMTVEADPEEVATETERVTKRYASQVRIPGFRKGKVPLDVIRARFADAIREDVREGIVVRLHGEATAEKGLRPLGEPVLEEIVQEEGKPFRFRTSFEVAPEFEPKGYHGVTVREPVVRVEDGDVNEAIESIRQSRGRFRDEPGREAKTGDVIVATVDGRPEGGEPFHRDGLMIEIGATGNLPEFNEKVLGVRGGDVREFPVRYPAEHDAENLAGKTVEYRLEVHEVKIREIPELDDEFARDLGLEGLDELRKRVRDDLEGQRAAEAQQEVRRSLLDKVLLENPIPLPDTLVETEIRHRLEDVVRSMMARGVDPQKADIDWKELRDRVREPARKSVHSRLVLDAVGTKESIRVEPKEVEERIREDAARMGEPPGRLRQQLEKHGGMEALRSQLVREKSLDFLMSVANIQKAE